MRISPSFRVAFILASFSFSAVSASECPDEKYVFHQVTLDAYGVLTRTVRHFSKGGDASGILVTDQVTLGDFDEVTLNASPQMRDASMKIQVRRILQKADVKGVISTTYRVRESSTTYWGKSTAEEKVREVAVSSAYLGDGKSSEDGCGHVKATEPVDLEF